MSKAPLQTKAAISSRHDDKTRMVKLAMMLLLGLMLASSLSACGKRGDPYRPSEVPTESTS